MKKTKAFFKYLYENLYNRYSIAILNIGYFITFVLGSLLIYSFCNLEYPQSDGEGHVFYMFYLFVADVILLTLCMIGFFLENKFKNIRIKNNPIINNKFYRIISVISALKALIYSLITAILLFIYLVLVLFENQISWLANKYLVH